MITFGFDLAPPELGLTESHARPLRKPQFTVGGTEAEGGGSAPLVCFTGLGVALEEAELTELETTDGLGLLKAVETKVGPIRNHAGPVRVAAAEGNVYALD